MAIMEIVRTAPSPEAAPTVACSSCGVPGAPSDLVLWGFARSASGIRRSCPACVRADLPAIETLTQA